jgi:hypothetical protein
MRHTSRFCPLSCRGEQREYVVRALAGCYLQDKILTSRRGTLSHWHFVQHKSPIERSAVKRGSPPATNPSVVARQQA